MMQKWCIDYINLDANLKKDELKLREFEKDFVEREVTPVVDEHFQKGSFPVEIIKELGKNKFIGSFIHGYNCPGYNSVKYGIICEELERADGGIRSFLTTQDALVMNSIYRFGSEIQKKKLLPELAKGKLIGCFGLVENEATSNPVHMQTTAIRYGNQWIINGEKEWITNALIADICILWAKTDEGIRGFIVDMGKKGIKVEKIENGITLRAGITGRIIFNDVVVSEEDRLPFAEGLKSLLLCINEKRFGMAWGAIGASCECFLLALEFAKDKIMFGRPVSSFQLIQMKLVNMLNEITKAKSISLQVAREKDKGFNFKHEMISLIAYNNITKALEIARSAKEIYGINGISAHSKIIRHLLNLESINNYEGTNDIFVLIIGKDITGMQAFF